MNPEKWAELINALIELENKSALLKDANVTCDGGTYWADMLIYEDKNDS